MLAEAGPAPVDPGSRRHLGARDGAPTPTGAVPDALNDAVRAQISTKLRGAG